MAEFWNPTGYSKATNRSRSRPEMNHLLERLRMPGPNVSSN